MSDMNPTKAAEIYTCYVLKGNGKSMDPKRLTTLLDSAYKYLPLFRKREVDLFLGRDPAKKPKKLLHKRSYTKPKPIEKVEKSATLAIAELIESLSKQQRTDRRWNGDNVILVSIPMYKQLEGEFNVKHAIPDHGINLTQSCPITCDSCGKTSIFHNPKWCANGCGTNFNTMVRGRLSLYAEHKATGIKALVISIPEAAIHSVTFLDDDKQL